MDNFGIFEDDFDLDNKPDKLDIVIERKYVTINLSRVDMFKL